MLQRRLYISLAFLCVVHAENVVYPTAVHQHGDTQTLYRASSSNGDHEDNVPASSVQVVNNAPYDTAISSEFIPHDAVQQYIAQHAGNGVYPPVYYPHGDKSGGFTVQTGYEGYLVPAIPQKQQPSSMDYLRTLMPSFPVTFLAIARRVIYMLFQTLGYILAGGSITAAVCAVTPFCRLTFLGLPFLRMKESAKTITDTIANEITEERVKRAAELVKIALEKYQDMQLESEDDKKEVKQIQ
ncbi:uncharacterized protein LOC129787801 [Lutzomyia longipalpis]|uniref:uncharacterized protein LOC129787801 n=1 Tax=Lutzomyia longipalpis TaxID=7200 RepID=UPI002484353A|nr:uncharacterized protein LOC129787801 [Lutzomyia longipalpis]